MLELILKLNPLALLIVGVILKLNPLALLIVGVILLILFVNIVVSFGIRKKYKTLIADIEDTENQENKIFEYELFNSMIKDYKKAQNRNIEEINTLAIIEKKQ